MYHNRRPDSQFAQTFCGAQLLRRAGHEGLVGFGADDAIEGKHPGRLAAQLKEEGCAVGGFDVDRVEEPEPGRAVKVGGIGGRMRNLGTSGFALR